MFRKKDWVLIVSVMVAAILSALMIALVQAKDDGVTVRVMIDGTLYGEYSLSQNQTVLIDETLGYNRLVIQSKSAYMADADCPDKYCMGYKPISKDKETIICLPHKLVVEVTGAREAQQPDVIVP